MNNNVEKIVWTLQAEKALKSILDYRYSKIPSAYIIVKKDIITASKNITFPDQYQIDDIYPDYRRIIVRDYKILYKHLTGIIYILNVICTKAG